MSRNFCGIIDFDHPNNDRTAIKMAEKMNYNQLYTLSVNNFDHGTLINHFSSNFPEPSKNDGLQALSERYHIAYFAKLRYKHTLIDQLQLKTSWARDISDEELILRGYHKWKERVVEYLEGDWAFGIWDKETKSLFLARNKHGDGTLFYYHKNNQLYFASLLGSLVGIEEISLKPDFEKCITETLCISGMKARTIYQDLFFLPPAHYLIFSEGKITTKQYWSIEETAPIRFSNDQEYFDLFYDRLGNAVKATLETSTDWAFSQSGGLDSSAVMGFTSKFYQEQGKRIRAINYRSNQDPAGRALKQSDMGDTSIMTAEIAKFNKNMDLEYISKKGEYLKYMKSYTQDFGAPPHYVNVWFVDALSKRFSEIGANNVINAQGGNQSISYEGIQSFASLAQFRNDKTDGLNLRYQQQIPLFVKSIIGSMYTSTKNTKAFNKFNIKRLLKKNTVLSDEIIESNSAFQTIEGLFDEYKHMLPSQSKFRKRLLNGRHCRLGMWNQIGSKYDVVYCDPSNDTELIELVAALPNHIFNRNGNPKYLYKQSFKDIVPPKVLNNTKTEINYSDILDSYLDDIDTFSDLIKNASDKHNLFYDIMDYSKIEEIYKQLSGEKKYSNTFFYDLRYKSGSIFLALLV